MQDMEDHTEETQAPTISRRTKIVSIIILSCTYIVTGSVYAVIAPFFPTLVSIYYTTLDLRYHLSIRFILVFSLALSDRISTTISN